ncbi:MAG: M48 family metallopeptidase [Gemmatimonadetes bacterium]|nr:M48 family metallopeptidase [Gemmatimonadota bacterium]
MTSVPAPRSHVAFREIAPVSWEHPADRAALQAMRAVPGFDEVVKKVIGLLGGERGIRLLFQGNAVRVTPLQYPRAHQLLVEVCATFDWPRTPEMFVSQTPVFNAGAYGVDDPFIVLHTAALELLDDEELRVLIAHEMGHVMSGHALYHTIAAILFMVSLSALPLLAGIALLPIKLAVLEWSRKSELSADRAGLLGGQNIMASQQLFMKMAGGYRKALDSGEMNLNEFMVQANEYANTHEDMDIIYKILNTLGLTHPMNTVRAAEIQKWMTAGDYDRILRGEYTKRGQEQKDRPLKDDLGAATSYYAEAGKEVVTEVTNVAKRAAQAAKDAFTKARTGA